MKDLDKIFEGILDEDDIQTFEFLDPEIFADWYLNDLSKEATEVNNSLSETIAANIFQHVNSIIHEGIETLSGKISTKYHTMDILKDYDHRTLELCKRFVKYSNPDNQKIAELRLAEKIVKNSNNLTTRALLKALVVY